MQKPEKMTEADFNEHLYREYDTGDRQTWVSTIDENREFLDGIQIKESHAKILRERRQPVVPNNEVTPAIDQVVGQLTAQKPRFIASAMEDSDVDISHIITDLFQHVWKVSRGNVQVRNFATELINAGKGCFYIYEDPLGDDGNKEIKITDLDPKCVYTDPASEDPYGLDASHKLIVKYFTKPQILSMGYEVDWSKAQPLEDTENTTRTRFSDENQFISTQTEEETYRVIDRYSRILVDRFHVYDPHSGFEGIFTKDEYIQFGQKPAIILQKLDSQQIVTKDDEVREFLGLYGTLPDGVYHLVRLQDGSTTIVPGQESLIDENPMVIEGSTTQIIPATMTDLLNNEEIRFRIDKVRRVRRVLTVGNDEILNKVLELSIIPIIEANLHFNRNPFPIADMTIIRPLQEQINKMESLLIAHMANSTNVKVFIGKGTINKAKVEQEWAKAGAAIMEIDLDIGSNPMIVHPLPLNNGVFEYKDKKVHEIRRILGAYQTQEGAVSNPHPTNAGILALDEMGHRRSQMKREKLEEALNLVGRIVLEMIPKVYDYTKMIRILEPNHEPRSVILNEQVFDEFGYIKEIKNDVSVGKYDIIVESGSMLPTNRSAELDSLLNLWDRGILTDRATILRKAPVENVEQIIAKTDRESQQAQYIEQLEQQIKDIQGDKQTTDRENVHLMKKVEVEKFKTELKNVGSDLKADAKIAKNNLKNVDNPKGQPGKDSKGTNKE